MNRYLVMCLVISLAGCATLAPGEDPMVVRTEQMLAAGDAFYVDAMTYYNTPGVVEKLGRDGVRVFETFRTGFDKPYYILQSALDLYKASKARGEMNGGNLEIARNTFASVLAPVFSRMPADRLGEKSKKLDLNEAVTSPFAMPVAR